MLLDVINRVASLSDAFGCRGLLVHAESELARGFYEHRIPEFERSPTDSLHLLPLLIQRCGSDPPAPQAHHGPSSLQYWSQPPDLQTL